MIRRLILRTALATALMLHAGCQAPTSAPAGSSSHDRDRIEDGAAAHSSNANRRDLNQDEAAGGHVLRKHVGRSDDELRDRLEREPAISGASTYTDRATAERVIGEAIAQNQNRIQRWLNRAGHANLVLDYVADGPVGRTLNRGDSQPRPCSHVVVVLRYDPPASYHVLTSYPECRP